MGDHVEWRPVPEFEGLYEVSSDGRVRSITRYKKEIKQRIGLGGYYFVQLWHKGKCKCERTHRLVAAAFCENPESKPFVNHKDENKLNNAFENLEWVTHKENCNYGTAIKRRVAHTNYKNRNIDRTNQIEKCSKPISMYTKDGTFVRNWKSISECAKENGWAISNVARAVRKERKTAYGYVFYEIKKGGMTYF